MRVTARTLDIGDGGDRLMKIAIQSSLVGQFEDHNLSSAGQALAGGFNRHQIGVRIATLRLKTGALWREREPCVMLSRTPERRMLVVRVVLLLGWLIIAASLLYDPFTSALTSPDNDWSPFRLGGPPVKVQGVPLALEPYPMGNRVFWSMIVPIVPLFLMLFGHETWRRICPLSWSARSRAFLAGRERLGRSIDPPEEWIVFSRWFRTIPGCGAITIIFSSDS